MRADAVEQTDQFRIQRFGGWAVCGNRAAIQRKNPAGVEQGVLRIVAGEKDGVALRTERGNLTEYADLIAKVQRGSRLVHQQNLCLLRQSARHQHELLLPAGELLKTTLRKFPNAELRHGLHGNLPFLSPGGGKGGKPVICAHHHHIQRGIGENRIVKLRDIGDFSGKLLGGKRCDVFSVQQDVPTVAVQQAQHTAKQRCFPGAVCPKNKEQLIFCRLKGNAVQNGAGTVGKL